jgi:fructose-specific phosphotransferase system IIC component
MRRLEQLAAIFMYLVSAVLVLGTRELPAWENSAPGPRFVPIAVAVVTVILASLLLLEARRRDPHEPADWPDRSGAIRVGLTILGICGFLALAPWMGFVAGSAIFALFMLLFVTRQRLLPSLFVTAVITGLIQGIFVSWLEIALPRGVFGG